VLDPPASAASLLAAHVGEAAALTTAVFWMASALAFEGAGKRIGSLSLNVIRLAMALLFLAPLAWALTGSMLPVASAEQWTWLALSSVAGLLVGDYLLFRAYIELGPRLSSLVMASTPVWTALIGALALSEIPSKFDVLGIVLAVSGIAWAIAERQPAASTLTPPTARGVSYALGGAFGQASGLVLSKIGMGTMHPVAATQIRVFAGLVGFLLVCVLVGWLPHLREALRDKTAIRLAWFGAVFGPVLGITLSLVAVQSTSNVGVAAALMGTTPLWMLLAVRLRGEHVGVGGVLGALVTVAGATLLLAF
jgi:drug/metabolite transporter (DMT)-like permease